MSYWQKLAKKYVKPLCVASAWCLGNQLRGHGKKRPTVPWASRPSQGGLSHQACYRFLPSPGGAAVTPRPRGTGAREYHARSCRLTSQPEAQAARRSIPRKHAIHTAGPPCLAPAQEAGPHIPVKEVVAANHPKKASGVGDRVEPVVHLLKLLVHDVSGFTLCLTAGTGPVGKRQRKGAEHCCKPAPRPRQFSTQRGPARHLLSPFLLPSANALPTRVALRWLHPL